MSGMYQCFHCLNESVIWSGDFDSEDYGYEENGIIHECFCTVCGAMITYFVPEDSERPHECDARLQDDGSLICAYCGEMIEPPFPIGCPECHAHFVSIVVDGE